MVRIEELDPDDVPVEDVTPFVGRPAASGGAGGPGMPQMPQGMEGLAQMMRAMQEQGGAPGMGGAQGMGQRPPTPERDRSRFKNWDTLYPRYLDIKAPHQTGGRRVGKDKALRWPLAWMMHQACKKLGFPSELEDDKCHPADWANPGRVKVLIKRDGKPVNRRIRSKQHLLNEICLQLRPVELQRLGPPTKGTPLAPIHLRLPPTSPAISHGMLANSSGDSGMAGMMQAFGMGGPPPPTEQEEEPKKEVKAIAGGPGKKKKGKK